VTFVSIYLEMKFYGNGFLTVVFLTVFVVSYSNAQFNSNTTVSINFGPDSSVIISFDDPALIYQLQQLLAEQNISATFEDVLECDREPSPCDVLATCNDVYFSYECICQQGYTGSFGNDDNHTCTDTNECEVLESLESFILNNFDAWKDEVLDCRKNNSFDDCYINSTYIQNFTMALEANYQSYNVVSSTNNYLKEMYGDFIDDDVISIVTSYLPCDTNSQCSNMIGSYNCSCNGGFTGNETGCVDVDECIDDGVCSLKQNTECLNSIGSFDCVCKPGYNGTEDGSCEDIDECSESVMCSINANCLNTEGSFMCLCKDGFEGNGFVCEENVEICDNLVSLLPGCENSTSLSCQLANEDFVKAQSVYNTYKYFFIIPDSVLEKACPANGTDKQPLVYTVSEDAYKICDIEKGIIYRRFGFENDQIVNKTEVFHFGENYQWFDTRVCQTEFGGGPIGCIQRYLSQRALTIKKDSENNYVFDIEQVYFESGCEVEIFT